MDGAFDMMHFGHMNAFRLGRELGTHLIVGINSDESITECKGPPLMNNQERLTMVESCKFVDQVLPGCPYIMNKEYLDFIIREYKVDYVIHGDDPCIVDGKDVYATAKAAGKYMSIPRTEGISTTDIVGRVLLMSKSNLMNGTGIGAGPPPILGHTSRFLTTSSLISKFSAGNAAPKPDSCVVYIDGDFDMFHCGHVAMLQAAKAVSSEPKNPVHGMWGRHSYTFAATERGLSPGWYSW
jgi:ethanolamine-phosphate cytidylyltransferase